MVSKRKGNLILIAASLLWSLSATYPLLAHGAVSFLTPANFPVGSSPGFVTTGDFNGDGLPDLAVANGGSNDVSILLGNGDGAFQAARNFAVGNGPSSIACGDFNGDGWPDLAVTNSGTYMSTGTTISILLGNGDGTFQAARNVQVGRVPWSIIVGDFNGDGIEDLAMADAGTTAPRGGRPGTTVRVLLGNGDGTFQAARVLPVGTRPIAVAVGDFNGDDHQDLAVANEHSDTLSILIGNGDGTFQAARNFAVGNSPRALVVGDFNGDAIQDLIVAHTGSDSLVILFGNGDGSFRRGRDFRVENYSKSVIAGDFNGDGLLDLAMAGLLTNDVAIWLGNGDGTFRRVGNFGAASSVASIILGDFNGDGWPDLAVANARSNNVSVLLGNGDGTVQSNRIFSARSWLSAITTGDFNGDGVQDLALSGEVMSDHPSTPLFIFLGNGGGTFQAAQTVAAGRRPRSILAGDFNGDDRLDLAVANEGSNDVSVLLGNGDGTFQPALNFLTGMSPSAITAGDFNGDKVQDLATANSGPYTDGVSLLLGNGDGTFRAPLNFPVPGRPRAIVTGDFNGDEVPDLAVATGTIDRPGTMLSILLGQGDGTFRPALNIPVGNNTNAIAVGDFNGDTLEDLALANLGSHDLSILLGNGDGTFRPALSVPVRNGPGFIAVGDFDGDEIQDLVVSHRDRPFVPTIEDNVLSVLLGNGDGSFREALNFWVGIGPSWISVGDFNGDRRPDLAVASAYSFSVYIFINSTPQRGPKHSF